VAVKVKSISNRSSGENSQSLLLHDAVEATEGDGREKDIESQDPSTLCMFQVKSRRHGMVSTSFSHSDRSSSRSFSPACVRIVCKTIFAMSVDILAP
jgi:hypothetical protein